MLEEREEKVFPIENIVTIKRVVKVVAGGRKFRFSAWVVVGDGNGTIGVGHGKAAETPDAIEKALRRARKNIKKVIVINKTIPHPVIGKCGASKVLLKPAAPGSGLIACQPVRSVLEAAGYENVLTKSLGSNNAVNLMKATMDALLKLKDPYEVARIRGKPLSQIVRRFMYERGREELYQNKTSKEQDWSELEG
ncbi:MAG: 30S ribosomal protein S5 [candidate division WOR-3 bacterium]|uniref:Small ribosomal subunit protein uS5 n=2 Tax=candidate division WOR-3 bacterium TaxID=2052148 RepID=A0A7V4E268_UNCW3